MLKLIPGLIVLDPNKASYIVPPDLVPHTASIQHTDPCNGMGVGVGAGMPVVPHAGIEYGTIIKH